MLCQFSPEFGKTTLSDYLKLPRSIYPVGRLDEKSEGLLLLTNDNAFKHHLLDPNQGHIKHYWVQVEGKPDEAALKQLRNGVVIQLKKGPYRTAPAEVEQMEPPQLSERPVRVDYDQKRGSSWLSIGLSEGKNRQVRKMTAAVGTPTVRLVRYRIEDFLLGALPPGEHIEVSKNQAYRKAHINTAP